MRIDSYSVVCVFVDLHPFVEQDYCVQWPVSHQDEDIAELIIPPQWDEEVVDEVVEVGDQLRELQVVQAARIDLITEELTQECDEKADLGCLWQDLLNPVHELNQCPSHLHFITVMLSIVFQMLSLLFLLFSILLPLFLIISIFLISI